MANAIAHMTIQRGALPAANVATAAGSTTMGNQPCHHLTEVFNAFSVRGGSWRSSQRLGSFGHHRTARIVVN
jgi:hypothetical protein